MHQINENTPTDAAKDPLPIDPSNTNSIGQHVDEGVVKIKESISKQSAEWEDQDERENNAAAKNKENYLKNPSPEENGA